MQLETIERIRRNPKYRELVLKRSRLGWTLAGLMLAVYLGFICLIAFAPGLLGQPLGADTAVTLGIVLGIIVILTAFVLTGLYVLRANSEFDRLNREILEELR